MSGNLTHGMDAGVEVNFQKMISLEIEWNV